MIDISDKTHENYRCSVQDILNFEKRYQQIKSNDLVIHPMPRDITLIKLIDAPKNIIVEWMKAYDVEALGAVIDDTLLSKAESKYQQMLEPGLGNPKAFVYLLNVVF